MNIYNNVLCYNFFMFNFDQSFFNIFYGIDTFRWTFSFASFLFDPIPFVFLTFLTFLALKKFSKNKKDSTVFLVVILISVFVTWILKYFFMIERPPFSTSISPSFPSAHSALASSYFLFLLSVFRKDLNVYRRYLHFAFCILCPIFVGVSRLYLGVHWLSDVLVGYLLGGLVVYFVLKMYK